METGTPFQTIPQESAASILTLDSPTMSGLNHGSNTYSAPEEDLVQVHPDRLCNFITKETSDCPGPQYTDEWTSAQDRKQVYKIPQQSKLRKKQFLRGHLATNVNSVPLGMRGHQASHTKLDKVIETTEKSTVH